MSGGLRALLHATLDSKAPRELAAEAELPVGAELELKNLRPGCHKGLVSPRALSQLDVDLHKLQGDAKFHA
jgi:hypothetical protein